MPLACPLRRGVQVLCQPLDLLPAALRVRRACQGKRERLMRDEENRLRRLDARRIGLGASHTAQRHINIHRSGCRVGVRLDFELRAAAARRAGLAPVPQLTRQARSPAQLATA